VIMALAVAPGASGAGTSIRSHFYPLALQHRHVPGTLPAAPTAGTVDCVTSSKAPNVNMDCRTTLAPNNEVNIAVDPNHPKHLVASSNDYESCCDEFYTSFNGGKVWSSGDISTEGGDITGSDPVSVISKKTGTVFHSSLNFANDGSFTDVVDSRSADGGLNWTTAQVVYSSPDQSVFFNDKEWVTVDNNPSSPYYGRVYITWTKFSDTNSPILMSHSSDDGLTWSPGVVISGNNGSICTYQPTGGHACDEDQFSVPTVGPDGTLYVSFANGQNEAIWEPGEQFDDQIIVVSSKDGGATWSQPVMAASLEDGSRDYPINVDGRQTITGLQLRLGQNTSGVAGLTPGTMYVVWSDNRNGVHDSDTPVTNSDVFMASSSDYGKTWTGPTAVSNAPSDQWQAWMDVNPATAKLGVVYFDRSANNPALYNTTLATVPLGGPITHSRVSTKASNPFQSLYFQAGVPGCVRCSVFNGDYNGIAFGSDGSANMTWTDMRDMSGPGHLEHGYFAKV
jgi:hypothetical protein